MVEADLAARPAFAGCLRPIAAPSGRPGVVVRERTDYRLATVTARRGAREALSLRLREAFGLGLPDGPRRIVAPPYAIMGIGPRSWLVSQEGGGDLAAALSASLGATAAVCDQSDGYAVVRIGGPNAAETLAKGLGIDLHPRAFGPDSVAASVCSNIGVTVWHADENSGANSDRRTGVHFGGICSMPAFELAMFRSYAASFADWLSESAAEFGLEVASG
jgi:sarcosine oxidase subunit gamma